MHMALIRLWVTILLYGLYSNWITIISLVGFSATRVCVPVCSCGSQCESEREREIGTCRSRNWKMRLVLGVALLNYRSSKSWRHWKVIKLVEKWLQSVVSWRQGWAPISIFNSLIKKQFMKDASCSFQFSCY